MRDSTAKCDVGLNAPGSSSRPHHVDSQCQQRVEIGGRDRAEVEHRFLRARHDAYGVTV
jgi:hypothetical protein